MKLYLVMLLRRPQVDPAAISAHMAFLDALRLDGTIERSGPFTDRSGGAYLLRAVDADAAQAIVQRDPAHTSGGWDITVHEWQAR
ncbi:YciI family protein [Dyella sp.]|uniref:YciI family protein n=1 Tax=Dyella sp. TaxID=1869338 RepID=UPI002D76E202|nr:YciI family protein [Dyella sp.]HET6432074.1 YciI family protein [Dyella sp.]